MKILVSDWYNGTNISCLNYSTSRVAPVQSSVYTPHGNVNFFEQNLGKFRVNFHLVTKNSVRNFTYQVIFLYSSQFKFEIVSENWLNDDNFYNVLCIMCNMYRYFFAFVFIVKPFRCVFVTVQGLFYSLSLHAYFCCRVTLNAQRFDVTRIPFLKRSTVLHSKKSFSY